MLRSRRAFALSVVCLVLAAPGWASAVDALDTSVDALEPVTDTVTDTTAPVIDSVADTVQPVNDAVAPVTDAVTDAVEPVTDTVTDTTKPVTEVIKPVTDTVEPVTDKVTDPVKPVTDTITDTTKPVTDTITDTTKPVTDTVTDTTKPVTDTTNPVTDAVRDVTKPVTDVATDTTKPVTDAVRDVTSPIGDVTHPVDDRVGDILQPVGEVLDDSGLLPGTTTTNTAIDPDAGATNGGPGDTTNGLPAVPGTAAGDSLRRTTDTTIRGSSPMSGSLSDVTLLSGSPVVAGVRDGAIIERIMRGLGEGSRRYSFPLTVAALVLLFLAVQGRLDARDPKLAARPEDEELAFA